MAADQPDRLAVQDYADRYFRPDHVAYITFAGLTEGVLDDEEMTDAERVAEIRLAMAALDLRLAEDAGPLEVSPAQPPYGSPEHEARHFEALADEAAPFVECACGLGYTGSDSIAELRAALAKHIAAAQGGQ